MQIKKNIKLGVLILVGLTTSYAISSHATPHTWHTVSSNDGTWEAKLQMINQGGSFETHDGTA